MTCQWNTLNIKLMGIISQFLIIEMVQLTKVNNDILPITLLRIWKDRAGGFQP